MWQDDEDFDLVQKACTFLSERRYPDGCSKNEKRIIRRKALKFVVRDGDLLYKKVVQGSKGKKVQQHFSVLVDKLF